MTNQTNDRQAPRDVPPGEVSKTLKQQLASLDPQRAQALTGLQTARAARTFGYTREKERLTLKYGAENSRVTALTEKARFNDGLRADLEFETAKAKIDPPVVDKGSFLLHGFVRNCAGEPKPGLTVALYDAQGGWIRAMGYGCTDGQGYFRMKGSGFSEPTGAAAAVATIRVYDKQTLLVTDAKPLPITSGKSEYRIIIVCDDGTCPPPPEDTEEPPPPAATMPDVVGKAEDTAIAELKKAGFTARSSTRGTDSKQVGKVIEQNPKGGARAARGSEVTIVIGTAEPLREVPNVVGQALRDARTLLENDGFVANVDPANAPAQNEVVKQSPAAGAKADRGTVVSLVVEVPVENVKVPAVEKLTFGEAKKAIAASGLVLGKIDPASAGDQAVVIAQKPPADTLVKPGSSVDLLMEKDQGQTEVPDVCGKPLFEARRTVASARLKIGTLKPSNASEKDIVTTQSPKPKARVSENTPVDLALKPIEKEPPKKSAPAKKPRSKSRKKRRG